MCDTDMYRALYSGCLGATFLLTNRDYLCLIGQLWYRPESETRGGQHADLTANQYQRGAMSDTQKRISEILDAIAFAVSSITVTDDFEHAVGILRNCNGKIITTGMGKAGHIARKFAATLCSTGTPAVYLHPGEAAHGDLGLVSGDDAIVAFSDSGETNEVVEMLEFSRHLGMKTIVGITANPESGLSSLSDITIDMGRIEEPCSIGLTPTACIAVMLAISDALALVLMEMKGITKKDFGLRHHGGYLGRKARLDNE